MGDFYNVKWGGNIKFGYELHLEKIQTTWRGMDLSLIGKITIIKSLATSKRSSHRYQTLIIHFSKSEEKSYEIYLE